MIKLCIYFIQRDFHIYFSKLTFNGIKICFKKGRLHLKIPMLRESGHLQKNESRLSEMLYKTTASRGSLTEVQN